MGGPPSCRRLSPAAPTWCDAWLVSLAWPAVSMNLLVFPDPGVHPIRPGVNATGEAAHVGEPSLAENLHCLCTARSHLAQRDDLATGIKFPHARRQLVQGNQLPADVGDLEFVFVADIKQEQI